MDGMGLDTDVTIYIVKLPFPLTIKFKSMLQAGVATKDMDPRWMSSISWYFLCFFGLQPVFNYILGSDNGTYPVFAGSVPMVLQANYPYPSTQPRTRWPNRWGRWGRNRGKCLAPVSTQTSNSLLRWRISLLSSITPSSTTWRSDCSRFSP